MYDGESGALLHTFSGPRQTDDRFGISVAAIGDDVLIGAHADDTAARNAGAAYLFDGTTGKLRHAFFSPTPHEREGFGLSVAAVGNDVLVGAPFNDTGAEGAGATYLFDGTSGALLHTFLNPTPAPWDQFGKHVAAMGNDILIAAPRDGTAGEDAGAVYLYAEVPEPSTFTLLAVAVIGLLACGRRADSQSSSPPRTQRCAEE